MTSSELLDLFRKDSEKVKEWRALVELPIYKEVSALLDAAGPQYHAIDGDSDSKHLGRVLGYADRANKSLLLATRPQDFTMPPPDYKQEN